MSAHIRFGEPIDLPLYSEKLPAIHLLVNPGGVRRDEPFQVYITQEAYDAAWQHVRSSPYIECGGVLAGHPFKVLGQEDVTFVVIVEAIRQDSDDYSVGHFTVSPQGIADARVIMEQKGYLAVGWYHSHPGHGVFLSGQDMTIVRSIYNSSWNVAWVIDPQRNEEAFFQGPNGDRLAGQCVLKEEPAFVKASALYKQGKDALNAGAGDIKRAMRYFRQLKSRLDDDADPSLAHWRESERYQYVQDTLNELSANDAKTLPQKTARISFSEEADTIRNDDLMNVSKRYNDAKELLRRSLSEHPPVRKEMSDAKQILIWDKLSGYRNVARLIKPVSRILEILDSTPTPPRRLSWDDERELEKLARELQDLLQNDREFDE